jgi:hypothetical protein
LATKLTTVPLTLQMAEFDDVTTTVSPDVALAAVSYVPPTSGMAGGVDVRLMELGSRVARPALDDQSQLSRVAPSPSAGCPVRE